MFLCESKIVREALLNFSFVLLSVCLLFSLLVDAKPTNGDMMFPEQSNLARAEPQCKGDNMTDVFCTRAENYPASQLESLLKRDLKRYMELFGEDLLVDIANRFDPPGEESLCRNSERLIFPQSGYNKEDQKRFIVNHDKYKQGIRIEECIGVGETCSLTESFPNNYKPECRQKYIYRPLLSLTPDGNIIKDQFRFPSSCKCVVKTVRGM